MKIPARILRRVFVCAAGVGTMATASARDEGILTVQRGLGLTVSTQIQQGLETSHYQTGSDLFSGEWLFGTYFMAGVGFCQMALQHPELKAEFAPQIERCIQELSSPRVREFDTRMWRGDALKTLENGRGHAAYLGYFNILLGLYRSVDPQNRYVPLNDRISAALKVRMTTSPNGLVETYPGQWFPMDNAPILASIALHDLATKRGDKTTLTLLEKNYRRYAVDPKTGLLYQALEKNGAPADKPRGSGSALASFLLGLGHQPLGREIFHALRRELATDVLGFGAIKEYSPGKEGREDIDSGPIVFGFGSSATGFSIGVARMYDDQDLFRRLWASALLAGTPTFANGRVEFPTAGPLGNAILFAMITAVPQNTP